MTERAAEDRHSRRFRISVEVPQKMFDALNIFAANDGMPRSQVLRRAIDAYLKERFEHDVESA